MADEYEALWRKAESAAENAFAYEMIRSDHGIIASQRGDQAAAAILRDHVEAKLAEVRAERDELRAILECRDIRLADRDRTIAEQAAELTKLREALNWRAVRSETHDYQNAGYTDGWAAYERQWNAHRRAALGGSNAK